MIVLKEEIKMRNMIIKAVLANDFENYTRHAAVLIEPLTDNARGRLRIMPQPNAAHALLMGDTTHVIESKTVITRRVERIAVNKDGFLCIKLNDDCLDKENVITCTVESGQRLKLHRFQKFVLPKHVRYIPPKAQRATITGKPRTART